MFKNSCLAFCLLLTGIVSAQDSIKTVLKPVKIRTIGLYVAPEFQYGQLDQAFTTFAGASGMVIFNRRLGVGFTGMRSLDQSFSPSGVAPLDLRAWFGGARLEYTIHPSKAVHFTVPLLIGSGVARADSLGRLEGVGHHGSYNRRGNSYWVVQPGIQAEANLLRNVQLFAGANYRFSSTSETNTTTLDSNVLQGFSANVGLKVGLMSLVKFKGKTEKS